MENVAGRKPNRLIHEKSPYLQQHAYNPVDWYPWGQEAFEKAKREDKPIFLSVGYSTCHWCHVMEHESFEDPEVAELLRETVVSIKVDREERPDVDSLYMTAVQAMTGQGGWPMTVFMTPDGKPFFAGTYFPPVDAHGRPSFKRLIRLIDNAWKTKRDEIERSGSEILAAIQEDQGTHGPGTLSVSMVAQAVDSFKRQFDARNGGFGRAPKFPRPMIFSLLLRQAVRRDDREALEMVESTLTAMARGGIYDQLGGGFARYSVDPSWLVPHFEKMLYDNALLARSYIEAYQVTGNPEHERIARETLDYVLRDMTHPEGGFYSAEDADSEGREGAYYIWTPEQFVEVLGPDAPFAMRAFGVTPEGNFEHEGETVLHVGATPEVLAIAFNLSLPEVGERLNSVRQRLFEARAKRVRPGLDDKVLTSWNGLMIGTMAYAARALSEPRYREAAERAARFVLDRMKTPGGLLRRWRDGEAKIDAYLDDYAFFSGGLLDLYEATFDPTWVKEARGFMAEAIARFWDDENGGFFFSSPDQDPYLKARTKDTTDNAIPSGNSAAADVLLRLAGLTWEENFRSKAEATLSTFAFALAKFPAAYPAMLATLDDFLTGNREVVVAGPTEAPETQALLRVAMLRYLPGVAIAHTEGDGAGLAVLEGRKPLDGKPAAYVCQRFTCQRPVTTPLDLSKALEL
ncbi:hypothetical protein D3C86_388850 [compost metagenome]